MSKVKEKSIAILTINKDVSKMSKKEYHRLKLWLWARHDDIVYYPQSVKKCRFRLMETNNGK